MARDIIEFLPEEFPELKDIPIRDAQVILLASAGIEKTTIADAMDISRKTVYDILERHKVAALIKGGVNLQSMLARAQIGTVMVEASAELLKKKSELKQMNAKQLIDVISKCAQTIGMMKIEKVEPRDAERSIGEDPMEALKKAITV